MTINADHLSLRPLEPGWGQLAERWELQPTAGRSFTINQCSDYAPGALVHSFDCMSLKGGAAREGSGYLGDYDEADIEALFALDDHARTLDLSLVGWCQICTVQRRRT